MDNKISEIPINKNWMDDKEKSKDPLQWNEVSFDHFILIYNSLPILHSYKKSEPHKEHYLNGSVMHSSKTYLNIYDNKEQLLDKIYIKIETTHNDSRMPELRNKKLKLLIEQVLRNEKLNKLLK